MSDVFIMKFPSFGFLRDWVGRLLLALLVLGLGNAFPTCRRKGGVTF
jgi:hypothetical protein